MMRTLVIAFLLIVPSSFASETENHQQHSIKANPIRKVVTMLQMMMKKIEAEGKKEQELYDKFMCFCKTADEDLSKGIEEANTKIPQLESDIKAASEEKKATEESLSQSQTDRDAAK